MGGVKEAYVKYTLWYLKWAVIPSLMLVILVLLFAYISSELLERRYAVVYLWLAVVLTILITYILFMWGVVQPSVVK